jgi:hypothetical protein
MLSAASRRTRAPISRGHVAWARFASGRLGATRVAYPTGHRRGQRWHARVRVGGPIHRAVDVSGAAPPELWSGIPIPRACKRCPSRGVAPSFACKRCPLARGSSPVHTAISRQEEGSPTRGIAGLQHVPAVRRRRAPPHPLALRRTLPTCCVGRLFACKRALAHVGPCPRAASDALFACKRALALRRTVVCLQTTLARVPHPRAGSHPSGWVSSRWLASAVLFLATGLLA